MKDIILLSRNLLLWESGLSLRLVGKIYDLGKERLLCVEVVCEGLGEKLDLVLSLKE